MKKRVAILGSTGHIAKGLIENLAGEYELVLFSRTQDNTFRSFAQGEYDVVINCIGPGEKLWTDPYRIFVITETYDNMVLDYLMNHPDALYINFSSGAVHFLGLDNMERSYYGIAKLNAESKHRALNDLRIIDIRVFSYFSRHLAKRSRCFINAILDAVRTGNTIETSPEDFYRDYIHPKDLARMVGRCIEARDINKAYDAYSGMPIGKFEMLDFFRDEYGLTYRIRNDYQETSPTGTKVNYYSNNRSPGEIGYHPQFSSMDSISQAAAELLCIRMVA